jgi:hypothetical protein
VVALALFLASGGPVAAESSFNPTTIVRLCNAMPASFPDPQLAGNPSCTESGALGAAGDVTVGVSLPGSDLNFNDVVTFTPNGFTIASGASMPAGTKVGGLRSSVTVGLLGGACNSNLTLDFVLYNVALPNNPANPRASTNLAYPRADGQADRFGRWELFPGSTNATDNVQDDSPADSRADPDTLSIQNYPKYLLDAFDPDFVPGGNDGPAHPLVPKAVYAGLSETFGLWTGVYLVQFDAGALTAMPGAFGLMTSQMGQPMVALLGDPTSSTPPGGGSIGDICSPVSLQSVLLGRDPTTTYTRATNPSTAGTYFVVQYIASQRDLDQDGYENVIDTCPKHPDVGSPKSGGGDSDGDRIDNACDPSSSGFLDFDEDNDGTENRHDLCPLNSSTAVESELQSGQADDYGPDIDQVGDACDTSVVSATVNARPVTFTLSATVSNGRYHTKTNHVAKCFGGTDGDGDGYCTTNESGQDGNAFRHQPWGGAFANSHALLQMDTDGDGHSDAKETYRGTEPTKACQQSPQYPTITGGANDEAPFDNWPMDFNDDQVASTVDVGTYVARLGEHAGVSPLVTRWDFNGDGFISTVDVGAYVGILGRRCDAPSPGGMGFATYSSQTQ